MDTIEQAGPSIWMDARAEGCLDDGDTARLNAYLAAADPRQAAEAEADAVMWERLHTALREDRTEVRPSFQAEVMAAVDPSLWEKTPAGAWKLPLAMMLCLALAAVWTLGGVASDHPIVGTGSVLADFVQSTFLAGAGVTVAAWRGVGMGLEEMLAGSGLSWVAMTMLVLAVNMLFVSLLRRRSRAVHIPAGRGDVSRDLDA